MTANQIDVPVLRFPEFSEEWKEKNLSEVFSIFNGYAFSSADATDDGVKWVKIADVGIQRMSTDFVSYLPSNFAHKHKKFLLKEGDFVLALTRPILNGKLKIAKISAYYNDSLLNQRVGKIISTNNLNFVYYILQNETIINSIEKNIAGTDPPNFSPNAVNTIDVYIPSFPEQQKIASFLTAIDAKIELLTKKKSLLEQYKKGVMQQLFSQIIRFKNDESNEFPEWEERELGDVAEIIMGQSPESKSYNTESKGMPLIQGNADIQDRVSNPRNWTSQPTKTCKIGDLLLTVRAPVGAVAKSIHAACIGRGICVVRNNPKTNHEFLYQFLLDHESKWSSIEQGSTFTAVSGNEIRKLKINSPSLSEQIKIADFLTAIDEKIHLITTQIEATKSFKKGLLQQLFV